MRDGKGRENEVTAVVGEAGERDAGQEVGLGAGQEAGLGAEQEAGLGVGQEVRLGGGYFFAAGPACPQRRRNLLHARATGGKSAGQWRPVPQPISTIVLFR